MTFAITIGGSINLESCYTALLTSDTNNDGYLAQSEFLTYLQSSTSTLTTDQYGSPLTTFSMLPQRFIGLYNSFACGDELVGCPSVIGIDIRGLLSMENDTNSDSNDGGVVMSAKETSSAQESTYNRLCKNTEKAVKAYEESVKDAIDVPTLMQVASVPTPSPTTSTTATTTAGGIVYVKAVQVKLRGGSSNNGGGSSSNNKWVVPVAIAASLAAILILFAGSRFRKRQREGKEFDADATEEVSLEEQGELANDLTTSSFSNPFKCERNMFDLETIEETPNVHDDEEDGSDLSIDLEQGGTTNLYAMNQPNEQRRRRPSSKSLFEMQQHQPKRNGEDNDANWWDYSSDDSDFPRPSWKEVSEDDLSKSVEGEDDDMCMRERHINDYRAGVEALVVQEVCPELALDELSAAGLSQWSNDDGMSSIDASMSVSSSEKEMLPDAYAAIGDAALAITDSNLRTTRFVQVQADGNEFSKLKSPTESQAKQPQGQVLSKEDSYAAIEAGDWNAVFGATASLLRDGLERRGSESDSSSAQSESGSGGSSLSLASMDYSDVFRFRADKFEELIEAGDWKAVMALASEFEGVGDSKSQVSMQSEMDYNDTLHPSPSDMFDKNNEALALSKRQEIEELVRRVVPDEMEYVDEMLFQFEGRVNELVMTLQTMEERDIKID